MEARHAYALALVITVGCGSVTGDEPSTDPAPGPGDTKTDPPGAVTPPGAPAPMPVTAACGHALRTIEDAREGAPPVTKAHEEACTFTDFDSVGAVLKIVQTFDAKNHVLTSQTDRIDEPPRQTSHDQVFVIPARHSKVSHQYDAAGRLLRSKTDDGSDGSIESERWWGFDAAGHEIVEGSSWEGSSQVTNRTFNSGGFLILESTSTTGDEVRATSFTRRADGAPLTSVEKWGAQIEASTTWTYDPSGKTTKRAESGIRTTTTISDAKGLVLEEREDQPKDGVDDYIHQYTRNAAGTILRDHSFSKDGEEYGDLVQTLDAAGRVVDTTKRWGFSQVNGPTTDVEKLTYDACGQVVAVRRFQNGKVHSSVDRTFDARGYLVLEEERRSIPQMKPWRAARTFNASGRVTQVKVDELSDAGTWGTSSTETRTYDASGHLLEVLTTSPSSATRREAWTFDAKGDLLSHEQDSWGPGSIIREETSYGCLAP